MKTSLKWLKDYVDIDVTPAELARQLTMAGLEVKSFQVIGADWHHVVVGQIMEVNPHPNADRLKLPTVDIGTEKITVVCGAPNVRVGDKVAYAAVGAELIDGHTGVKSVLKPAKIRGVVSNGMLCSEKELGISDNHTGLLILPPDAPIGAPLSEYMGDAMFNLEVTPNRPDCLSVVGIAREVAALSGRTVHLPADNYAEAEPGIEQQAAVEIQAPELCPRYSATLIKGVKIAESPAWMKERLVAGGMRPINNIVDITNFVMLEYGQPLHSFDFDRLQGKKIIVRRARAGEKITTLDNNERTLASNTLVIADTERAVAVAGVMGGANTEVTENTTSILLESANFNPASIHYTGRTLGVASEAAMRFERGIRPDLTVPALRRATQLMHELAGGEVARGMIDVYPGKKTASPIVFSVAQIKRILGIDMSRDRARTILTALGFDTRTDGKEDELVVTPPYWRSDVRLVEDLVEEVARIDGYEKIPVTMMSEPIPRQDPLPILRVKRETRQALLGLGFDETLSQSLIGIEALNRLSAEGGRVDAMRLSNPMTAEQEYLRPTLRANLLSTLAANQRSVEGGIRLVEISKIFLPRDNDLPDERETACGVMWGPVGERWWQGSGKDCDFFTAKGVVEAVLSRLNVDATFEPGSDPGLHPGAQAAVMGGGKRIGVVGEVHPRVRERFEINGKAYLFELDLPSIVSVASTRKTYRPIPKFPATIRDVAIVVDSAVTHRQVLDIMRGFPMVQRVSLFDVYSGEQVPAGKKSLAYRLTFQSASRTLTDEAVAAVMSQILEKLKKELGAELRK